MFSLEATHRDNRGTDDPAEQYGFVYFNDDRRVAYTSCYGVSEGTGGWSPVTDTHIRLAREFLIADGVKLPNE